MPDNKVCCTGCQVKGWAHGIYYMAYRYDVSYNKGWIFISAWPELAFQMKIIQYIRMSSQSEFEGDFPRNSKQKKSRREIYFFKRLTQQ